MTTKSKAYLVLQSAVCVLLAALLAVSAVKAFREGSLRKEQDPLESIYSPETVAERFAPIIPLFLVSLGLLAAGVVLGVKDKGAERPVRDPESDCDLAAARAGIPSETMLKERAIRKLLSAIGWGAFALCMLPVAVYLLIPTHFPERDLESMFLSLLRVLLPWTGIGIGVLSVTSVLAGKSAEREMQAALKQMKEEKTEGIHPTAGRPAGTKPAAVLRTVIAIAAVILIITGVINGSARDVLCKAISICTECVGLG